MEVKAKAIWLSAMGAAFLAALISLIVVSANTEPFPLDAFLSSLQRSGYEVKTDMTSSELLRGRVVQITLTGEDEHTLLLYQYPNAEKAGEDAVCIDSSGSQFTFPEENGMGRSVSVEWVDAPHFYLYRNAIVQYTGSDSQLLLQLESLCGPPFAGEGSDKNGYTSQALTLE